MRDSRAQVGSVMMKLVVLLMVAVALVGCGEPMMAEGPEAVDAAAQPAQDATGEALAADAQAETEAGQDGGQEAEAETPEAGAEASVEAEAGCPDAPCQPADVNCDPGCGAVDPACAAMCDINADFAFTLPMGVTRIRMPRFDAQMLQCSSCYADGAWWSFLAKLPDESCGTATGPVGMAVGGGFVKKGDPLPGTCAASKGAGCGWVGSAPGPDLGASYVLLTLTTPAPGFVVAVDLRPIGECSAMGCLPTCNGSPQ